jgi:hypothetical protein
MRTFVSFDSDLGKDSTPPGLGTTRALWESLRNQGISGDEPSEHDDYGWRIDVKVGDERLFLLIQRTTDHDDKDCWLGIVAPMLGFWSRIRRRGDANQVQLCNALHRILIGDVRFREVRWYTREDWERHPENAAIEP